MRGRIHVVCKVRTVGVITSRFPWKDSRWTVVLCLVYADRAWRFRISETVPCLCRYKRRVGAKGVCRKVVYALGVVCKELWTEVCVSESVLAKYVQFAWYVAQRPVLFFRWHEVYSETRSHDASVASFFPVDCEWIEVIVTEIHHWEYGIHKSCLHPLSCILTYNVASIPAASPLSWKVSVFAKWWTT